MAQSSDARARPPVLPLHTMIAVIRPCSDSDADLATYARVVSTVDPAAPIDPDELRWERRTYPDGRRFLAEDGRTVVGAAAAGRIHVHPADFHLAWLTLAVLPAFRRLGTGTALFAAASEHARKMGKDGFQLEIDQTSADGLDFLGRRGFRETGRSRMVERDLRDLRNLGDIRELGDLGDIRPQDPAAISGIRFTTLADEPGLLQGVHQVAVAAFPDIPIGGDPWVAGELDEFRARDVDRPGIPLDAFMIAVEEGSGRPVGYASLQYLPGSRRRAWHDMTGVLPEFRGRRIATALKLRTIRWAVDAGLDALITGNDVENAPMRAINARLGYRPLPDRIELRGPLAEAAPIVRF